ncbi:MAG: hypothetical protein NVV63_12580 [Opitutus sp.]|nr:hypothetical protein [Opitutus sp.]
MSTPTTLDLRNLPEAERDDRINEAVHEIATGKQGPFHWVYMHVEEINDIGEDVGHYWWHDGTGAKYEEFPRYATSADAVLPLLEKFVAEGSRSVGWSANQSIAHIVTLYYGMAECARGQAQTFPLAACIALLRAHGIKVLL